MLETRPYVHVVLFGLAEELASDLSAALNSLCGGVDRRAIGSARECQMAIDNCQADIIFCDPDAERVRRIREQNPNSSIIAVSRLPEVSDWLDAIEAGANDYCAAPFENTQMRWVLESSLRHLQVAA